MIPQPKPSSPLGPAFVVALVAAFLAFSAVMLATLLYLVLLGGGYDLWLRPLGAVLRFVAAPFAAVVFTLTLIVMYRRFQ